MPLGLKVAVATVGAMHPERKMAFFMHIGSGRIAQAEMTPANGAKQVEHSFIF
jgi:hypothetical protein